ncbi:hypothetical protein E1I69_15175 [Bacillus timonensis]|uniref:Uncharacterized protein n=1 Tax=Bacillus timonensis TaxID=1033734 RepID=A0A4S3PRI1_9BACI|nr:hypothetical protein [Bacillus timonensis]THE11392.1 hypothetical protein E1I69_15175 [Bacillus timonensis]
MKRSILFPGIVLIVSFISASSDDKNDKQSLALKYETQIEEKDLEISMLKDELILVKYELEQEKKNREKLQIFDHNARNIMNYIAQNEFDKIRSEFDVELEVIDGKLYFDELADAPVEQYFPTEIAGLPMYFSFYNPQNDFTEVGYFLYGYNQYGSETKYDIHFRFGKEDEFMYVGTE